jgi:tRNA G18 (ribose-2'-O)-methylase SpoU
MGNVFLIPWTFTETSENYVRDLKELGFYVGALALDEDSISIEDPVLKRKEKLALVLGNEGHGLPQSTIKECDYTVMIPMTEGVDSLNVAAASAVAFWEITRD